MSNSGRFKRTGKTGRWPIPPAAADAAKSAKPAQTERKPSGRIVHDERGNAVWNFGNDTMRNSAGSSTIMRRLEVPELQLEGQASTPPPARAKSPAKRKETPPPHDEGGGYNPYNAPAKRSPGRGR